MYFTRLLAGVFGAARDEALRLRETPFVEEPPELRRLDHRARVVLGLFARQETITAVQAAEVLGLSDRMARNLLLAWVADGWLVMANASRRGRTYRLSAIYRQTIGSLSAI